MRCLHHRGWSKRHVAATVVFVVGLLSASASPVQAQQTDESAKAWVDAAIDRLKTENPNVFRDHVLLDHMVDPGEGGDQGSQDQTDEPGSHGEIEASFRAEAAQEEAAWQEARGDAVTAFSDAKLWREGVAASASRIDSALEQLRALTMQQIAARNVWVQDVSRVGTVVAIGVRIDYGGLLDGPPVIRYLDGLARNMADRSVLQTMVQTQLEKGDKTTAVTISIEGNDIQPLGSTPLFGSSPGWYFLVQVYRVLPNISDEPDTSGRASQRPVELPSDLETPPEKTIAFIKSEHDLEALLGEPLAPDQVTALTLLLESVAKQTDVRDHEINKALSRYEAQKASIQSQIREIESGLFGGSGALGDIRTLQDTVRAAMSRVGENKTEEGVAWSDVSNDCSELGGVKTIQDALNTFSQAYSISGTDVDSLLNEVNSQGLESTKGDDRWEQSRLARNRAGSCAVGALTRVALLAELSLKNVMRNRDLFDIQREKVLIPKVTGTREEITEATTRNILLVLHDRTRRFLSSRVIRVEEISGDDGRGHSGDTALVFKKAGAAYYDAAELVRLDFPKMRVHRYFFKNDSRRNYTEVEILVSVKVRYTSRSDERGGSPIAQRPGTLADKPPGPCAQQVEDAVQHGDGLWEAGNEILVEVASGTARRAWLMAFSSPGLYPNQVAGSLTSKAECGWKWRLPTAAELRTLTELAYKLGRGDLVPASGVWTDHRDPMTDKREAFFPGRTPDVDLRSDGVTMGVIAVAVLGDQEHSH